MKKPNLFLVGVPRAGTTSLYEYLKQHPEVFMSEIKGPNFFGEEKNESFPEFHKNGKKYLFLFKKVRNEKKIGDASHLFSSKIAPKQIKKFNSKSKIIIILRNPIEVVMSYYNSEMISNKKNIINILKNKDKPAQIMLDNLKYTKNIKKYLDIFDWENTYIIIFEEFVKNPKKEFSKLCKFLGINQNFKQDFKIHNPSRKTKNKWIIKILDFLPTKLKLNVKNLLPKKFIRKLKVFFGKITTNKKVKKFNLKKEDKKLLNSMFEEEIKKTEELLGKKLPW